jgi:hypothetical protein
MSAETEKSKIIVDEDWKAQVQAEKEAAKTGDGAKTSGQTPPVGSPTSSDPLAPGSTEEPPQEQGIPGQKTAQGAAEAANLPDLDMPPASLVFLCTTLATQAMIALGQVPNPLTGKTELRLKQAKHYIDTLGMLEEKTTGNRTADETALFTDLLHQLRMAYVMIQSEPANK